MHLKGDWSYTMLKWLNTNAKFHYEMKNTVLRTDDPNGYGYELETRSFVEIDDLNTATAFRLFWSNDIENVTETDFTSVASSGSK